MEKGTSVYSFASTSGASTKFLANTTQYPFPLAVIAIAMILLIVGMPLLIQDSQW
jgi:lambda repressor-like predicted transcriptional regulator